ncbi:Flagellar protein FlgJ N-terminal domain-containing protein [Hyphomicrobium sp. 1Nfss2.1]|uniref:rod-binding protein n=1 Tax=Hyphomicrobium sp. 1Nfss2.1 TaxID=3413936 RepID=UPI003C7DE6AE
MTSGPDIILGVSRAADAVKQRDAAARLERLSRAAASEMAHAATSASDQVADWSTELKRAAVNAPETPRVTTTTKSTATASVSKDKTDTDADTKKANDVYVQFEALLLQNMVETMLPKESEAIFGRGTAGEIWKSMMAEQIANQLARTGTIGIAKQISSAQSVLQAAGHHTQTKVDDV